MWGVLTRLEEPNKAELSLMQKLKLYDGKTLPGYTEDNIRRRCAMPRATKACLKASARSYIRDKILSNALVSRIPRGTVASIHSW